MRTTTRTKYCRGKPKYKRRKIRRQQHSGFLNRYDFTYAEQDVVNQGMKGIDSLAPKLIGQTSREIDKIGEARIKQVLNDGGQTNSKNRTTNHVWRNWRRLQNSIQAAWKSWKTKLFSAQTKNIKNN